MFKINDMLQYEVSYYELFTNRRTTDWGIIYHNPLNPDHHDGNHTHILNLSERIDQAIREIIQFYRSQGLTPRINNFFIENELEILRPRLESFGFSINFYNNTFMRFVPRSVPVVGDVTQVRRVTETSEITGLIQTDGEGEWAVIARRIAIKQDRYHLLVLFRSGEGTSMASLNIMDGYSRVDDVKTCNMYRRQGFGTRIMSYLVNYHATLSDNHLYLYTDNPIAIKMYKSIGFEEVPIGRKCWSAYLT